jgi:hypothetical protein
MYAVSSNCCHCVLVSPSLCCSYSPTPWSSILCMTSRMCGATAGEACRSAAVLHVVEDVKVVLGTAEKYECDDGVLVVMNDGGSAVAMLALHNRLLESRAMLEEQVVEGERFILIPAREGSRRGRAMDRQP